MSIWERVSPIGRDIRDKLSEDEALSTRIQLPLSRVVELLKVCFLNSYLQVKDIFYTQAEGVPMSSTLSPVIENIYIKKEIYEQYAISTA